LGDALLVNGYRRLVIIPRKVKKPMELKNLEKPGRGDKEMIARHFLR